MRRALSGTYRIGPLGVAFEPADDLLGQWARLPHAGRESRSAADVTIRLAREPGRLDGPTTPRVERGERWQLAYWGWRATYDPRTRVCEARISERSNRPARGPRRVASLTRVLLGALLLERGGLAFHGAALVRGGDGYLFVGPRGAGKTTVARTWPADAVLGDDHAILTPEPGGWRLWGTPYAGREGTPCVPGDAPIRRILLLCQSPRTEAAPVPAGEAFGALVPHVIHAGVAADDSRQVLAALDGLVRQVPVARLMFNRTDDLWEAAA